MADESTPADHVVDEKEVSGSALEEHLKSRPTWLRLVFMFVFYFLASIASLVASVVIVLGFLWVLFTGETNEQLKRTGQGIASYVYQIIQYLTYNSDVRPFPFDADWPAPEVEETEDPD
ncbi:MAG: DUF4389 domain-containing protein [Woeseiaceae bacterium]|nr:DUF4389 domain-containing protein [Woeseiaceae bacterium]